MTTLHFLYIAIFIGVVYLYILLRQPKYRLPLPCIVHTAIWTIVCVLILLQIVGTVGVLDGLSLAWSYDKVVPFILGLMISSIVGFSFAHKSYKAVDDHAYVIDLVYDRFLVRFKWICYLCFVIGFMHTYYIISVAGFDGIVDYRRVAISLHREGYGTLVQQFSGHASILGGFYIAILGCKHACKGINIKEFLYRAMLIATTNIAIGGRIWIITTLLPYFIGYWWQCHLQNKSLLSADFKKMLVIIISFLTVFSVFGTIRNETESNGLEKFLYLTDGSRMSNFVLGTFPEGSYELEYGRAEFLYKWIGSPMIEKYSHYIEDDPWMSVTVFSSIPPLYFDFGYWGGILMWGFFCFIIEKYAIRLRNPKTIFGVLVYIELCKILFQSPVGQIFYMAAPTFLWFIIIYMFRKTLFYKI